MGGAHSAQHRELTGGVRKGNKMQGTIVHKPATVERITNKLVQKLCKSDKLDEDTTLALADQPSSGARQDALAIVAVADPADTGNIKHRKRGEGFKIARVWEVSRGKPSGERQCV